MNQAMYAVDARIEQEHWWFVGRRKLYTRMIRALNVDPGAPVLDLGFTEVSGLDRSADAIRFCAEKGFGPVIQGSVTAMPFADQSFALVIATDIIEHVDDDVRALAEIRRVLRPGGAALVAVPAFPALWGFQDDVGQHKRRYRMRPLLGRIQQAGLVAGEWFHYNYLLFGPIWLARRIMRHVRHSLHSENEVNSPLLNKVLSAVFAFDVATAPRLAPPFGVSILVVAHRPG
jgi:SAM-dependent methyltransferase